jgi:hypothetical protein
VPVIRALVIAVTLCASAAVAHAYPQFQLGKEAACTACHLAPAGGGLLDGMGPLTAEDIATFGGHPGFLHGVFEPPEWLLLGGEFRSAAGVIDNGDNAHAAFIPMQYELHAALRKEHLSAYVTAGYSPPSADKTSNAVLLREHWVMYRTAEGVDPGYYVRAGRYMPTYGLRMAEHPIYTRKYGGTPLYGETYNLSGGYISPGFEVHATAFLRDRLRKDYALEQGDGFAVYTEKRVSETLAVGGEFRFAKSPAEWRAQGGLTAKYWFGDPQLQFSGELQLVHQKFDAPGSESRNQLVGYGMVSWLGLKGFMFDLGLGHFDEDISIKQLDRNSIDLNLHWFTQTHVELILMNRVQTIGFGDGGDTSFYSMVQVHYRL